MIYQYYFWYCEEKDDFWGSVYWSDMNAPLYEIATTVELTKLIKNGIMKHIDDCKGLENHLRNLKLIGIEDQIVVSNWIV
jgi:hypothetical protein